VPYVRTGNVIRFNSLADVETFYSDGLYNNYTAYFDEGALLKDLGKEIILTAGSQKVAILRYVQLVSGAVTEGVPNNYPGDGTFYTTIYHSDPGLDDVGIVRVG